MTDLKIEKGIKPTEKTGGSKYPFAAMEIGDSLLDPDAPSTANSPVRASAIAWGKLNDVTFSSEKVEGGVRIWRKT